MTATKRPRRLLKIAAVLLLLGLVLLFFAPAIASGPVRSAIASNVEGTLQNARVEIGSTSFSWFGTQTIENFAVHDTSPDAGSDPVFDLSVTVEQSLLSLLLGGADSIVITANGAIHGIVYEDGSTNFDHIMPPPAEEEDTDQPAALPGLDVTITSLDVTIDDRRTGTPVAFDGASAKLLLARGGDSTFTLNAPAGANVSHGPVEADMRFASLLKSDGMLDFAVDRISGDVNASNFPTAVLSPFVAGTPLDLQRDLGPMITVNAEVGGASKGMSVRAQSQHLDATINGTFDENSGALAVSPSTIRWQAQPGLLNELAGRSMVNATIPILLELNALTIPGGSIDVGAIGVDASLTINETVNVSPIEGSTGTIPFSGFNVAVRTAALGAPTTVRGGWSLGTGQCSIEQTVAGFLPSEAGMLTTLRADGTVTWKNLSLETLRSILGTMPEAVTPILDALPRDTPMRMTLTTSTTADDRLAATLDARLPVGDLLASAQFEDGMIVVQDGAFAASMTPELLAALPGAGEVVTLSAPATVEARLRAPVRLNPGATDGPLYVFGGDSADAPHVTLESANPINLVLAGGTPITLDTMEFGARIDGAAQTIAPSGTAEIRIPKDAVNAMLIPAPEEGEADEPSDDAPTSGNVEIVDDLRATVALDRGRLAWGETGGGLSDLKATLDLPRTEMRTANGSVFTVRRTNAKVTAADLAKGMQLAVNAQFPKDGSLTMDATVTPTPAAPDAPADAEPLPPTLDLKLDLAAVPTAFIDALAQLDGLLVDAIGDTVGGTITTKNFSPQRGRIDATLTTDQGTLELGGRGRNNALRFVDEESLTASLEVTESLRRRLLSGVHPVFKDVKSTSGPITMSIRNARIPLDGNLKKLNAEIEVNVGDAQFDAGSFMFAALLFSKQPGVKTLDGHVDPIKATIQRGVLTYDKFNMRVGDVTFAYNGTINLNNQKVDLNTEVPLGAIVDVFGKVEETKDTVVPLSLRGTLNNPKQGIAPDFDLPALLLKLNLDDKAPGLSDLLNIFDRDKE